MDTQHFIDNLAESNLVSDEQLQRVRSRAGHYGLAREIASDLLKEGLLTEYQIKRLEAGDCAGLVLGQYRILSELGRGGFGQVYQASHCIMDRIVALKVIAPERVEDERIRAMFLREVRAVTRLHHPNIALAYDAGEAQGRLYMAMELVDGPTLDQLIRKQGPLTASLAWPMLQQAALALAYAHEQGMVHRDVKPANLLIPRAALAADRSRPDAPPLIKVVDFGLARLQSTGAAGTLYASKDRLFAGTPDFVSPEQARCVHEVDIRSDLYSLGCTFYYALAGHKPFQGANALEIVLQHFEKEAEPLEHLRPELPPALTGLIRRLMEKQPDRRFQSPAELLAEMGFLGGGGQPFGGRASWAAFSLPPVGASSPNIALPPSMAAPAPNISPLRKSGSFARPVLLAEPELSATVQLPKLAVDLATPASPGACEPASEAGATQILTALTDGPPIAAGDTTVLADATKENLGPAGRATAAPPSNELRRAWALWRAAVAALVDGARSEIGAAEYRLLYAQLMRELRTHMAGADAKQREYCRCLDATIEPWLNLAALTSADKGTLRNLLERASALAEDLGIRTRSGLVPMWLVLLLLFLLTIPLGGMSSLHLSNDRLTWHLPSLHTTSQFVQANPILSLTLLLPGIVAAALYGLSRFVRMGH